MSRLWLVLGLLAISIPAANAQEEIAPPTARAVPVGKIVTLELIDAHREYQQAKLRMHKHRFTTLPQHRRLLDDQIRLAQTEIAVLQQRLRDYRPFLQVGEYSPVRTAAESHYLALVAAEQRLRHLQGEQISLMRHARQYNQLYQLDVLQAATRVALARKALEQ